MKKTIGMLLSVCLVLTSVAWPARAAEQEQTKAPEQTQEQEPDVKLSDDSSDFVLLSEAVPDAILEIRYYSTYNFVGDRIDGYEEPLAFLTKEAAAALREVSDELVSRGYRLKIFDAYRPQKAVTNFMNWALDPKDTRMKDYFYPELDKDVLFPQGYIAEHSGHSRGSTVDLTLFDMTTEREVDMGGTFDYFGELSHPDYKDITDEQYANRMLLREVMTKHGFKPLVEEWWHFTLEDEPFPDTYFTFPINSDSVVSATGNAAEKNGGEETESEEVFSQWNEDADSLNALVEYVEKVTEEGSKDFIPAEDRIAVFDMDGTLMGELYPTYLEYYMLAWRILKDPSYEPDEETLQVGRTLRDCALDNSFPEDMAMQHALAAAKAYSGMTLNEFADFETEILLRDVDGFEGMTYGESFYLPMVEVIEYLQDNDFTCYVCSGSDRFICRTFIEGMLDIPYENIIGMDVELEATGQGEEDGLNYVFSPEDDVVRTDHLLIKNLKTNKVLQIAQEIGRQPVLSFGNSSGDVSMHNYTISNNPYPSEAFMLIADDDVRDYGNPEKGEELRSKWEEGGYHVISMANDWKTIYGENVVKTGEFHWMEELADDRTPAAPIEEEEPAASEEEEKPAA